MKSEVLLFNHVMDTFIQSQQGLFTDLYLPERRLIFRKATFSRQHSTKQCAAELYSKAVLLQSQSPFILCVFEQITHPSPHQRKTSCLLSIVATFLFLPWVLHYSSHQIWEDSRKTTTAITKKKNDPQEIKHSDQNGGRQAHIDFTNNHYGHRWICYFSISVLYEMSITIIGFSS